MNSLRTLRVLMRPPTSRTFDVGACVRLCRLAIAIALLSLYAAGQTASKTTLGASPNPSVLGAAVTLTATVTPSGATGKVTFYDGVTVLGTRTLAGGQASLTTRLLPSGVLSLKAYYAGEATSAASVSPVIAQTVVALPQNGFRDAVSYNAPIHPGMGAVEDLDGDGNLDLLVASRFTIGVLMGNGDGTFKSMVEYSTGDTSVSLKAADFNADGKVDLAGGGSSNYVRVMLGNGDGSFQPPSTASYAGFEPSIRAVADFDGDGKADLIVDHLGSSLFSFLRGNGDGTFQNVFDASGGASPLAAIMVGDFNADGKADLAIASHVHSSNVNVIIGNGDGSFQPAVTYDAGQYPDSLAISDFNGDGKTDLIVTNSSSDKATVLLGNGDGTFRVMFNSFAGNRPGGIAVADFDGNGIADLAVANYDGNSVSILLGVPANADLTIRKTHTGNFAPGQSGATYSITVSNSGSFPWSGAVSVTDMLPIGLSAAAISGAGWSCTLGSLSCTRNDALGAFASYPAITLTVNVARDAPTSVTNTATVSGAGELSAGNNTASDVTLIRQPTALALSSPANPISLSGATTTLLRAVTLTVNMAPQNGFQAAVNYSAGIYPVSVLVADFSGDGKQDLAVVNATGLASNAGSVMLGSGNGTFQTGIIFTAGTQNDVYSQAAAAGDFNGDGKTDLVVVDNGVSVLLGNGNGTFQAPVSYDPGIVPTIAAVAVADFSGDGRADIVVATSSSASVLKGNGDGTFQPGAAFNLFGSSSYSLAVGDFNADGKADLVSVDGLAVRVLLGNGNATFRPAVTYGAGTNPFTATVGDLNGDGKSDLAVVNSDSNFNVTVLLGNGDGTFQAAVSYGAGTYPQSLVIADCNGDGKPDLLVANRGSNNVSVLLGRGDGTFQAAVNYGTGSGPASIAVGDFDADGRVDLAVANSESNNVSILLGAAATGSPDLTIGKTHTGKFIRGQIGAGYRISVSNLTGLPTSGMVTVTDTLPSGLTATAVSGVGWSCTLATLTCTRSDALGPGASYPPISLTVNVATAANSLTNTATVSGGGDANAANNTASDPTTVLLPATVGLVNSPSSAVFGQAVTLTATVSPSAVTGKVTFYDGTTLLGTSLITGGQAALVTSLLPVGSRSLRAYYNGDNTYGPSFSAAMTQIVSGLPQNGFRPPVSYGAGSQPYYAVVGDFNRDGKSDLAVTNSANTFYGDKGVYVLLGSGNGTFQAAVGYAAGPYFNNSLAVSDFNADGKADLAVAYYDIDGVPYGVHVLLGNGDGTFQPAVAIEAGSYVASVAVGDFNRDGKPDLAVAADLHVGILLGNGDGTFQAAVSYFSGFPPSFVAIGDFNEDGKPDLTVVNYSANNFSVLLGNGDGTFQAAVSYSVGSSPQSSVIGDLNGDGKADLAVTNSNSNSVSVLLGNGDGTFQPPVNYSVSAPSSVALGDFNADRKSDLAVASGSNVGILTGNGDGTFQAPVNFSSGVAYSVSVGEFNGDGISDLVVAGNYPAGNVSVLLGLSPVERVYLAGDVAPFSNDAAPNFGDSTLNVVDLVQVLFAVNNVPGFRPAVCADRFDAMDLYPVDTAGTRGGDGALDIRDLVRELFRVNNIDLDRPQRVTRGLVCSGVREKQGTVGGAEGYLLLGNPEPAGVPVYIVAQRELTRIALTLALGDGRSQLRFIPAAHGPTLAIDRQAGVLAVAWLDGITVTAGQRLLLGHVTGSTSLTVYGLSASGSDDNREVRLSVPGPGRTGDLK